MGWLRSLLGTAAPIAGSLLGGPVGGAIGSALGGAIVGSGGGGGSTQSGTQTTTQQQQMDPRVASMLFGDGTDANKGMLSQYQGMLGQPQNAGMQQYGQANDNYVGKFGAYDMEQQRDAANRLMAGNTAAPTMQAAQMQGTTVNAPAQNGMDLTGSYDSLINGQSGANPYLTGAIGKGINQSNNAFGNMVSDATKATQDVLGGIRSNSVLAGQYGGSRQGIAEGKAIESMNTQLGRAASQFGQNNTDAAVAAQAGAYDSDRNRQLAATQGLGAQQYGVASQNATMAQQTAAANAGFAQQAAQNNQQAQLGTNAQNQAGTVAGMGGINGLLAGAAGQAQNQDAYSLNQAGKVNSLLSPYLGQVPGSSTTSQPLYENRAGNMLGGAAAGLGLYNQYKNAFGSSSVPSSGTYAQNDWFTS